MTVITVRMQKALCKTRNFVHLGKGSAKPLIQPCDWSKASFLTYIIKTSLHLEILNLCYPLRVFDQRSYNPSSTPFIASSYRLSIIMPHIRHRNHQIWNQFLQSPPPPGAQEDRVSCKWCTRYQNMAAKVCRMQRHLLICKSYYEHPANQSHEPIQRKLKEEEECGQSVIGTFFRTEDLVQTTLAPPKISLKKAEILDELASLAIYVGGRHLNFFDEAYLRAFVQRLNSSYKLPSRRNFSEELLNKAYTKVKQLVLQQIRHTQALNFVIDESSNINYEQIINISLHTPVRALYLESLEMEDIRHGGIETADYAHKKIMNWCEDDASRINSIATDTESTMRLFMASRLKPDWQRVFWAPCDSHGLQLLMKHISELEWFKIVFKDANTVVSFFRSANRQLAIFRRHMKDVYGHHRALTLSVLTRWGTQFLLINSITRSQEALGRWAIDPSIDRNAGYKVIEIIQRPEFWADLNHPKTIFEPAHQAQVMSKSLDSHLGLVYTRWTMIKSHLDGLKNNPLFPAYHQVDELFQPRNVIGRGGVPYQGRSVGRAQFERQLLPIHHVAYHLDPRNHHEGLQARQQTQILDFFDEYIDGTDEEKQGVRSDFFSYKHQTGGFALKNRCWKGQSKPILFWQQLLLITPKLANLALRIYRTAANSVACERAFSAMNLLHNKFRNRTTTERMDKLLFIYINARVLKYQVKRPPYPAPPNNEDGPNKRRKTTTFEDRVNESWLHLDDELELDIEEDYVPKPHLNALQEEEVDSDVAPEEDESQPQAKTSTLFNLLT